MPDTLLEQVQKVEQGCYRSHPDGMLSVHMCCINVRTVIAKLREVVEAASNVLIVSDPDIGTMETMELRQLNNALAPMPEV